MYSISYFFLRYYLNKIVNFNDLKYELLQYSPYLAPQDLLKDYETSALNFKKITAAMTNRCYALCSLCSFRSTNNTVTELKAQKIKCFERLVWYVTLSWRLSNLKPSNSVHKQRTFDMSLCRFPKNYPPFQKQHQIATLSECNGVSTTICRLAEH